MVTRPMAAAATGNEGASPATVTACTAKPPNLLAPATQPVARPRTRRGLVLCGVGQDDGDDPAGADDHQRQGNQGIARDAGIRIKLASPAAIAASITTREPLVLQRL